MDRAIEGVYAGNAETLGQEPRVPVVYRHRDRYVDANGRPVTAADFGQMAPDQMDAEVRRRLVGLGPAGATLAEIMVMPDGPTKAEALAALAAAMRGEAAPTPPRPRLASEEVTDLGDDDERGTDGAAGGGPAGAAPVERAAGDQPGAARGAAGRARAHG
jgi:hypothetical protein